MNRVPELIHKIEYMRYFPMGYHMPVYNRPYTITADYGAIETLVDRMSDQMKPNVETSMLGDIANRIIQPNSEASISLLNDTWLSEPRYIFVMKVLTIDPVGTEINSYIQGYTNFMGISQQGHPSMEMVHHINNVIETYNLVYQIPGVGVVRKEKLYKSYSVHGSNELDFFTQRPYDVMTGLDNWSLKNEFNADVNFGGSNINFDILSTSNMVSNFNGKIIASRDSNSVPAEYLASVLNAGISVDSDRASRIDANVGRSVEMYSNSSATGNILTEFDIKDNRFIVTLSRLGGYYEVMDKFTFNELMLVDKTIYDRFDLFNNQMETINPAMTYTPNVGEHWQGSDPVTLKAYSLIESCVSLASRHGFDRISFIASNMVNPTGLMEINVIDFQSYVQVDDRDKAVLVNIFKNKLEINILIPETQGGRIPIYMEMHVNLLGTSKILLGYAGYPETWYTIPTTASSLYNPVLTFDEASLDVISGGFQKLITEISSASVPKLPAPPIYTF